MKLEEAVKLGSKVRQGHWPPGHWIFAESSSFTLQQVLADDWEAVTDETSLLRKIVDAWRSEGAYTAAIDEAAKWLDQQD